MRTLLREDQLVIVEVKVTQRMTDDGEAQGLRIIAENVYDLATIRKRHAKGLRSRATATRRPTALAEILAPFRPGDKPDRRRATATTRVAGEMELPDDWRVNLDDALIERLREWLAPENVQVVY